MHLRWFHTLDKHGEGFVLLFALGEIHNTGVTKPS